MRSKIKIGIAALLLLGAGLVVMAMTPAANADITWEEVTATTEWKNIFGQTLVTTKLTESWEYNGFKVTWYNEHPDYTFSKAWWVVWAYDDGVKSGVKVHMRGWHYHAYGTAHYHAGIPTPWGAIGVNQDMYTRIHFYGDGSYPTESGFGYET